MIQPLQLRRRVAEQIVENDQRRDLTTVQRAKGIQQMLDAVIWYLPAPTDVEAIKTVDEDGNVVGERICSDAEPFSALAFKIMTDPYVGKLTYLRVYSGTLRKGGTVLNTTKEDFRSPFILE